MHSSSSLAYDATAMVSTMRSCVLGDEHASAMRSVPTVTKMMGVSFTASGLNLWKEWAHIEIAGEDASYELPQVTNRYAGIVLTLVDVRDRHQAAEALRQSEERMRILMENANGGPPSGGG